MLLSILVAATCAIAPPNDRLITETDLAVMRVASVLVISKIGASGVPLLEQTIRIRTEPKAAFYPTGVDSGLYARLLSRNHRSNALTPLAATEKQRVIKEREVDGWIALVPSLFRAVVREYPHGFYGLSLPVYSDDGLTALMAYHDVDLLPADAPEERLFVDQQFIVLRKEGGRWVIKQQFGFTPD